VAKFANLYGRRAVWRLYLEWCKLSAGRSLLGLGRVYNIRVIWPTLPACLT
jgi:hypothetical protein